MLRNSGLLRSSLRKALGKRVVKGASRGGDKRLVWLHFTIFKAAPLGIPVDHVVPYLWSVFFFWAYPFHCQWGSSIFVSRSDLGATVIFQRHNAWVGGGGGIVQGGGGAIVQGPGGDLMPGRAEWGGRKGSNTKGTMAHLIQGKEI